MHEIEEQDIDPDTERAMFMRDVKKALRDAGFPASKPGFPYAMHHNFYRAKIRLAGKKLKHFDIARLVKAWMDDRDEPSDYAWQNVTGAVKDMISRDPTLVSRIPTDIRKGMASVEDGYAFLRWVAQQDVADRLQTL
jgi:hypothetical protein